MASFQAKTGWDRLRMREKKIIPISSYPIWNTKFRKNSKKIQKIKKHQQSFFKTKTGRDRLSMRGKKNYRSNPFKTEPEQGIPKKQQKTSKKQKTSLRLLFKPKQDETG